MTNEFKTLTRDMSKDAYQRMKSRGIYCFAEKQQELANEILHPKANIIAQNCLIPKFPFRKGELTIWAGANGAGKSAVMNMLMLDAIRQGNNIFLLSMEMRDVDLQKQMLRLCYGHELQPNEVEKIVPFMDLHGTHIWTADTTGGVSVKRVIDDVAYMATVEEVKFIVIDNLTAIAMGGNNDALYQKQKEVIVALKNIATNTGCCIQLVAHLRKSGASSEQSGNDPNGLPSRYDISGSGDISNLADNVVLVNRNKRKETEGFLHDRTEEWDKDEDTMLSVDKYRATGEVILQKLWRDKASGQLCWSPNRYLQAFLPDKVTGLDRSKSRQLENLR